MYLGTANIKNFPDMPKVKVQADARRMAEVCHLWGAQENDPREDDDAIMSVLDDTWEIFHQDTNIPVYYRQDKFRIVGARVQHMPFDPELPLTPRPRVITGTTFRIQQRKNLPPFVVINVHFIAGGMNGDNPPDVTARRKRQWTIEWGYLQSMIQDYKLKGLTVFVLGDFNHPRPPRPTRNFMWLCGERLDRIGVTRTGGVEAEEIDSGVVELNSDHNGQWSRVILSKMGRA